MPALFLLFWPKRFQLDQDESLKAAEINVLKIQILLLS